MNNNTIDSNLNISIITPSYNMGEFLEETINSVLTNLKDGDEYYIIDGGSTDKTLKIIEKYESDITGWVSEADDGYAHAIKKGFDRANSAIMCWINVGDLLLPGAFDIVRDIYANNEEIEFIFGDDYYINETGSVLQHSNGKVNNLFEAMLYGGWTPLQDACFWKRKLYNKVGGIKSDIKYAADYELFLRMSRQKSNKYYPYILSAFRKHDEQKSISFKKEYKSERKYYQNHMIRQININRIDSIISQFRYKAYVYLRAKNKILNSKKTKYINNHISALKAFK